MLSLNKKQEARMVLKTVLKFLDDQNKLDFEYTTPSGEVDVTKKLFNTIFDTALFPTLDIHCAKHQTSGWLHGIFIVSKIATEFHLENFKVHIQNSVKQLYSVFEHLGSSVIYFDSLSDIILGVGDILILDPVVLEKGISTQTINDINDKQVVVMVSVDSISITKNESIQLLNDFIRIGLSALTSQLTKLNSFIFNFDDSRAFAYEGLKTGHLFFKFEDPEFAAEYEQQMSSISRLTISTPTKLGADLLRVLLNEKQFSQKFVDVLMK